MRNRLRYAWLLGGIVAAIFGLWSDVHALSRGGGAAAIGAGTIPGTPFGGAVDPSMVQAREGFQVIPSVSVGQRYDSNVFFVRRRQGLDRDDFVTTAVPQVRGYYVGNWFDVNAQAAAIGEYYAKNTSLNYVGTNTGIALDLSKLVDRWWQNATWTVSDTYIYTPNSPAFLIGDFAGVGADPFASGFQVGRVTVSRNTLKTDLSIPLNQTLSLTGGYSNGFLRFGTSEVLQDRRLIDSNYQTYTAGLSMRASPQDVLSVHAVNYENTFTSQPEGSFTRHGGTVGWEHTFSPFLTMKSHAGVTSLERELGGVTLTSTVAPVGGLALFWKDRTTSMGLVYNVGVAPSLQFQAEALRTHVVSFTLTQETAIPKLLAVANLNYGRGDQFGSSSGASLSYVSIMGTGGVVYRFSPETFLGLNYSYSNFDNNFGGNTFGFDRHVVQMSLTRAFY